MTKKTIYGNSNKKKKKLCHLKLRFVQKCNIMYTSYITLRIITFSRKKYLAFSIPYYRLGLPFYFRVLFIRVKRSLGLIKLGNINRISPPSCTSGVHPRKSSGEWPTDCTISFKHRTQIIFI